MEQYIRKLIRGVHDLATNYNDPEALSKFHRTCDQILGQILTLHSLSRPEQNGHDTDQVLLETYHKLLEEHHSNTAKSQFFSTLLNLSIPNPKEYAFHYSIHDYASSLHLVDCISTVNSSPLCMLINAV